MLDLRKHYSLPPGVVELRAFTHGAMPRSVPAMMQHFVDDWQAYGVDAWNSVPNHWLPDSGDPVGWWSLPEYLGDTFIVPLIGAQKGTCIMQPNVHWTMSCLLSDAARFRGRRVVVTDDAFPSILHTAGRWAGLVGFELEVVPASDRHAVLRAVEDRCGLVVLTHVGFTTGALLQESLICEIADRVHGAGGLLAVDGFHAVGTMPISVSGLGADFYMAGLLKEGSGSSGAAVVYIRPGVDVEPQLTGWFGTADPFAFEDTPLPHPEIRRRFLGGTTAVAPLYHAVEGVRSLISAGLDMVREDSLRKTEICLSRSEEAGLAVRSPRASDARGAMVVLEVEHADLFSTFLKQHRILTDSRLGRYLRLAPFVWNPTEEVEAAMDFIVHAARSREYLSAATRFGPVT